jgi:hypothetical protein
MHHERQTSALAILLALLRVRTLQSKLAQYPRLQTKPSTTTTTTPGEGKVAKGQQPKFKTVQWVPVLLHPNSEDKILVLQSNHSRIRGGHNRK